jgi:hypothetical protein
MEVEHVEHAVALLPLLCIGMFVLLLVLATGIAAVVLFVKLVSSTTECQPPRTEPRPPRTGLGVWPVLGMVVGAGLLLLLLGLPIVPDRREDHRRTEIHQELRQLGETLHSDITRQVAEVRRNHELDPRLADAAANTIPNLQAQTAELPADAAEAVAESRREPFPPTDDRTDVPTDGVQATPAWLKPGTETVGESQFVVVSSKQYATLPEARADADRQVIDLLRADLRRYTSQTWVRPDEIIGLQESLQAAVRDQYVETVSRDFGSFFAPMHRVWYRVELSPATREPALIRWRAALANTRMVATGGGFLALLCVPLAIVGYARCNRWTGGKARRPLACAATAAVLAVWAAGAVLFARFFVLWG